MLRTDGRDAGQGGLGTEGLCRPAPRKGNMPSDFGITRASPWRFVTEGRRKRRSPGVVSRGFSYFPFKRLQINRPAPEAAGDSVTSVNTSCPSGVIGTVQVRSLICNWAAAIWSRCGGGASLNEMAAPGESEAAFAPLHRTMGNLCDAF